MAYERERAERGYHVVVIHLLVFVIEEDVGDLAHGLEGDRV